MNSTGPYSNFLRIGATPSRRPKVVLTIGGSDPTSGAGIQADLKTFQQFGLYGLSVITAVTVQNTRGVISTNPVSAELVEEQLSILAEDIPIDAIKIGMLTTRDVIEVVSDFVEKQSVPTVLDPIVASSNGIPFLENDAVEAIGGRLCPLVSLITPNLSETSILTGISVQADDDMLQAALHLIEAGAGSVLIKGGHASGPEARDLFFNGTDTLWLSGPRNEKQVHGTGCVLSSAIASGLALGYPMKEAIQTAKEFITSMIEEAVPLGTGQEIFQFSGLKSGATHVV